MNRYKKISLLNDSPVKKGKRFFSTTRYPEIPLSVSDIYVITQKSDRYDLLANQYYNDPSFWWVISSANPEYIGSMYPPTGVQIRIPGNLAFVLNALNINE